MSLVTIGVRAKIHLAGMFRSKPLIDAPKRHSKVSYLITDTNSDRLLSFGFSFGRHGGFNNAMLAKREYGLFTLAGGRMKEGKMGFDCRQRVGDAIKPQRVLGKKRK